MTDTTRCHRRRVHWNTGCLPRGVIAPRSVVLGTLYYWAGEPCLHTLKILNAIVYSYISYDVLLEVDLIDFFYIIIMWMKHSTDHNAISSWILFFCKKSLLNQFVFIVNYIFSLHIQKYILNIWNHLFQPFSVQVLAKSTSEWLKVPPRSGEFFFVYEAIFPKLW